MASGATPSVTTRLQDSLTRLAHERRERAADPVLGRRTEALKAWQRRRMETTYADLLADPRQGAAMRFLIDECTGGREGGHRGRRMGQLARLVPMLTVGLPSGLLETVTGFADFQALTESLDTALARRLGDEPLSAAHYRACWQAADQQFGRHEQLGLMLALGRRLDALTRDPLVGLSLRMLRVPAGFGGLGSLQRFLEQGYETFAALQGAGPLLDKIDAREAAHLATLVPDGSSGRG